jgi:hypothetical protein
LSLNRPSIVKNVTVIFIFFPGFPEIELAVVFVTKRANRDLFFALVPHTIFNYLVLET